MTSSVAPDKPPGFLSQQIRNWEPVTKVAFPTPPYERGQDHLGDVRLEGLRAVLQKECQKQSQMVA